MRHRFHALCPYFAMFPESFAEEWIEKLTFPDALILDPFCGRGTLPFQALLMGRRSVACDINPVAYVVSHAKTHAPTESALRKRITVLEGDFVDLDWEKDRRALPDFFRFAYQPKTLRQLLYLRSRLRWSDSNIDCMLSALVLGSLHGESERSPSFLSNQMPHTISTKPAYSIRFWKKHNFRAPRRNVFELLRNRVVYRYATGRPQGAATILHEDMRNIQHRRDLTDSVDCVITSPPYFDVTSFEEDQWLRLWFLGLSSRPTRGQVSRDDRHEDQRHYWSLIGDFWRSLGQVVKSRGHVVIRIGAVRLRPNQLVDGLEGASVLSGRKVRLVQWSTSPITKRQTDVFRPGSRGCKVEVDCHFRVH